jgi:hypothetical protein
MKIRNGIIASGAPEGKKMLFSSHPCRLTPTMLTPMKCSNEIKRVTIKELVTVKEYGRRPTRFATNRVRNR